MAKLICLQSGHEGVTSGATGALGEKELNVRIRNRLSEILISKGFQLQLVNANPTNAEINKDFDLFLALHGDANIYGTGGGCITAPDLNYDDNWNESNRISKDIESLYFKESGIVNHPERINVNMTRYYMWSRLTSKTACVILEMGVVQDAHDKVILADTDRVCNAIARGVCKAFSVPFDQTAPIPPPEDWKAKYTAKNAEFEAYKKTSDKEIVDKANKIIELQEKIEKAKTALS